MDMVPKNKIKFPIAGELTIPESELKQVEYGDGLMTNWITTSAGFNYALEIYSNDFEHKGEAWIYFHLNNRNMIEGKLKISIASANYICEKEVIFDPYDEKGEKLCTTEELFDPKKQYIVNGTLKLKMDGYLMVEKEEETKEAWKWGNSGDSLGLVLWEQESAKDFKIIVGEKEIAAHKCVLSARSPVFARMFESGMKEEKEGKVAIEDFSFDIIETAVKLLYHQSLVTYISFEDKIKVLQFFDKYDIQQLKNCLETYFITVVNETNVCRLSNAALLSNARKLEETCSEFLRDCLKRSKPISDVDLLDKDFGRNLLKNAFYPVFSFNEMW